MTEAQQQTIKNNLVAFAAVGIGAVSQLYIYPLDLELKGFVDGLLKWVLLLVPVFGLGMHTVMIYFPPYSLLPRAESIAQFLYRSLVVSILVSIGLAAWLFTFGENCFTSLQIDGWSIGLLGTNFWLIWLLFTIQLPTTFLTVFLDNIKRITISALLNNLLIKIGLPLIILATYYQHIQREFFSTYLVLLYAIPLFMLFVYVFKSAKPKLVWKPLQLEGKSRKDIIDVAGFSILGAMGSSLAVNLDTVSVNTLLGNQMTAIYSFSIFVTAVMIIPYRAVTQISGPLIAQAYQKEGEEKLELLYKQTANTLYALAGFIFVGIIVCLPYVYEFTQKTKVFAIGYNATVLLGVGQLFDQMTSINGHLIGYSKHYRWNILFVIIMGVLNVGLNYLFLVTLELGITGAALATAVALLIYNAIKVIFIQYKMGIHPFSWNMVYTTVALVLIGLLGFFTPTLPFPYFTVLVKGALITLFFFLYVRYTSGLPEVRQAIISTYQSLTKKRESNDKF